MDLKLLPQSEFIQNLAAPLINELPGEHIARCIEAFEGCSLTNNPEKLAYLFAVNEKDLENAKRVSRIQTSCATTVRAVWALAGCEHPKATSPYKIGEAMSNIFQIAGDLGALISCKNNPDAWKSLDRGWVIYYNYPGTSNDHVEVCLGKPDPITGTAPHIGGGRFNSLISKQTSDIRKSMGRPIMYIIDPSKIVKGGPQAQVPAVDLPVETTPVLPPVYDREVLPAPENNTSLTVVKPAWQNVLEFIFNLVKKFFTGKLFIK